MVALSWALVALAVIVAADAARKDDLKGSTRDLWKAFKAEFDIRYVSKVDEVRHRKRFFKNVKIMRSHNMRTDAGLSTFYEGINQFSDLTLREFLNKHASPMKSERRDASGTPNGSSGRRKRAVLPASVDMRHTGCISPVGDQGVCSASFPFAAMDVLEYHYCMPTGRLVSLSKQEALDCTHSYGNNGCGEGGWVDFVWLYVRDKRGIATAAQYPYKHTDQACQSFSGVKIDKLYILYMQNDDEVLKRYIAKFRPIAVNILTTLSFFTYHSGIYDVTDCKKKIFGVTGTIVGYGVAPGVSDYWIVKISYGTRFGMKGYVHIRRGAGKCKLFDYPLGMSLRSPHGHDCADLNPCTAANRRAGRYYFKFVHDRAYFVQCGNRCTVMPCAKGTEWRQEVLTCDWPKATTSDSGLSLYQQWQNRLTTPATSTSQRPRARARLPFSKLL